MSLSNRLPIKRVLLGVGAIGLAVVAVAAATGDTDSGAPTSADLSAAAPKVGAPAPEFTAVDTRGASHSLAAYRGQWVVLEWFNHDCPYTKKHYKAVNGRPGNTQATQR